MIKFDIKLSRGGFLLDTTLESDARVIGLFGPSGAGKSTLLNILTGTITPANGKIVIDGRCLLDTSQGINVPVHQRRIGMVYQNGRLFPHLSVKHNLTYGMRLLPASAKRFDLKQIVDLLEIGHLLDNRPHQLSGGEQQRVALGRALLSSPQILLLDEPMASLDERLKAQILPFLRRIKEETAVPMIYVSHSIREILELTQQLAVIQAGTILAYGNFHEVINSDAALSLAQSLGLENVLPVMLVEHHAESGYSVGTCGGHRLILPLSKAKTGSEISVVVPASTVALSRTPIAGITIQNQIAGIIKSVRLVGHRALVSVDIGTMLLVEITEKAVQDLHIQEQDEVFCLIKAQTLRILGE